MYILQYIILTYNVLNFSIQFLYHWYTRCRDVLCYTSTSLQSRILKLSIRNLKFNFHRYRYIVKNKNDNLNIIIYDTYYIILLFDKGVSFRKHIILLYI